MLACQYMKNDNVNSIIIKSITRSFIIFQDQNTTESEHNIKSTKDFIPQIKTEPIPAGYEMVSFDAKSLFFNLPLDRTIDIILKRIYDHKEFETPITRCEMKNAQTLYQKCPFYTQ